MSRRNKTVADGSYDLPKKDFADSVTCFDGKDDRSWRVYSFGVFSENPLTFSLPIVMLQIILVTLTSRLLHCFLRPIQQPRIVCDIVAGILTGPEILGRLYPKYNDYLFPDKVILITRTLAAVGLMFYLFLIGVKMDPKEMLNSGRKGLLIGVVTTAIPLSLVGGSSFVFRFDIGTGIARGNFLIFIVASLSITAFPVLADILSELQLLNSELGRLAMSCAMFNDVVGWFFMALFTAMNQSQNGLDKALWSLASLFLMVLFVLFAFRPWMKWIVRRTPRDRRVSSMQLSAIVFSVIAMGLASDMVGASFVDGPLIMGLVVPDGPPLGSALVERIGHLANEVMLPLLFNVAGAIVKPSVVFRLRSWIVLIMLILLAYVSKVVATMAPALYCDLSLKKAFILGLIMSFRGLIELITYINFKNGSLLDDDSYTLLLFSIVMVTGIATPLVKKLYKPVGRHQLVGRRGIQHLRPIAEMRILVCIYNEDAIPAIFGLLEASSPTAEAPLCVYVLHLVELSGRANSTLIAHKNKKGYINPTHMDRIHNAFINFEQDKRALVAVQPFTAVAPLKTMHQDICSLAGEKNAAIVIIPVPAKDAPFVDAHHAFRSNIPLILAQAPCSVGLLVHRGLTLPIQATPVCFRQHVGVLFWGGPDDREALAYAARMVRHPGVRLSVTRFAMSSGAIQNEKESRADDQLMQQFLLQNSGNERAVTSQVMVEDMEQSIAAIRDFARGGLDLVVVGRRLSWNSMLDKELEGWCEFPELGVVGDMIASSDVESSSSILVVQKGE
ncbi:hypothetical protein HPP92_003206 [Vanilla planifolia]|uniref:Cation/H+ exchanger domain-containing protein n=1 Tax=Vanilla planifolia TaxID=51239 RepID=A0A835S2T7_VANPL|nr:hypothetical protein HPP92_003206 [Vanilla planifolia]